MAGLCGCACVCVSVWQTFFILLDLCISIYFLSAPFKRRNVFPSFDAWI